MKHLGIWLALAAGASAVPIKPDLQKILKQDARPKYYEPARAGWNGPEMARPQNGSPNPYYEAYGPASTVRMIRASLVAAVMPNPVALLIIAGLILLLRYVRKRRFEREGKAVVLPIRPPLSIDQQRAA